MSKHTLTGLLLALLALVGVALWALGKTPAAVATETAVPRPSASAQPSTAHPAAGSPDRSTPLVRGEQAASPPGGRAASETVSATALLRSGQWPEGHPERRLIEIYALIEAGRFQTALDRASELVRDHPNFQLAQLVYGDLLRLRYQPSADLAPSDGQGRASAQVAALRAESRMRLQALQDRPAPGHVPRPVLAVSAPTRHVIAIDASKSRLYLLENQGPDAATGAPRLKRVADAFISVGKSGIRKQVEGDGRTPLGIYFVTSVRERKGLPEFYGAGALPINYPNAFDLFKGRTGSGIWLHGTPPNQFVRAPLASDGCVVLSNPDMQQLLAMVAPRTTPVVIAEQLDWVDPSTAVAERQAFESVLQRWQADRSRLSPAELAQAYPAPPQGLQRVKATETDWAVDPAFRLGVANLSLLHSNQPEEGMVASFEETVNDRPTGVWRRQHWLKQDERWWLLQDSIVAGTPSPQLKRQSPRIEAAASPDAAADATAAGRGRSPVAEGDLTAASGAQAEVRQAVLAWSKAWSQKNMPAYFQAYDSSFVPAGGVSRKAWEKDRTERIVSKSSIRVTLSHLNIRIQGDQATAQFVQHYQADRLQMSSRKTLKLVRRGRDWRITHESVG